MFSLSKLIPQQKANLRPGVFSYNQVTKQSESFINNSTQDTTIKTNNLTQSVDNNQQNKKTPYKPQHVAKYSSEINIRNKAKPKENSQPKNLLEQFQMFQMNAQKSDLLYQLLEQNMKNSIEKKQLTSVTVPSLQENNSKRRTSSSPQSNMNLNSKHKVQKKSNKKAIEQKKQTKKPDADPYFLQQKQSPVQGQNLVLQQIPSGKANQSGKKLNFNISTPGKQDCDNVFLDSTNQMANMIIENILNKDDHYERIKKENLEIKEQNLNQQKQIADLKKKILTSEAQTIEFKQNLEQERSKYQTELMKFQDKLSVIKNLQISIQNERTKNEASQKTINELQKQNSNYNGLISSAALASIDYLSNFSSIFQTSQQDVEMILLQLLKMSVSIVLEIIQKAQSLKLPALNNCHIPESLDLEEFFTQIEQIFLNNKNSKNQSSHNSSRQSNSSEVSFRQKPNNQQSSLPLSQVQYKQPSNSMSLQEQFNTFLAMQEEEENEELQSQIQQLGSPYFTHTMQMELQAQEGKNSNLPRQMKEINNAQMLILSQNQFQTDFSDSGKKFIYDQEKYKQQQTLRNFHSFNKNNNEDHKVDVDQMSVVQHLQDTSANDTNIYDSLFQEMNNMSKGSTPPKKQNSMHTLKYLDEQVEKSKQIKKQYNNKENNVSIGKKLDRSESSDHCQDLLAVAKFDYQAQKENDLTFKKGEKIQVLKKTKNGWWIGLCKEKIGYFPYNFVTLLE